MEAGECSSASNSNEIWAKLVPSDSGYSDVEIRSNEMVICSAINSSSLEKHEWCKITRNSDQSSATIQNKRNGIQLLERETAVIGSGVTSRTKQSWLSRLTLRTEHLDRCAIEAGDELELSVKLDDEENSNDVEKCGVYMIVEKLNDSEGSAVDAHWKSCLIRELQQSQIWSVESEFGLFPESMCSVM